MPVVEDKVTLPALRQLLKRHWGYDTFRPLQIPAVLAVVNHRDSLVVLPTGGGKSLCFQVPALHLQGMAVVISPLVSLMKDQVDDLRTSGIPAAFVNSTLSAKEKWEVANAVRAGKIKLLYVAPERLKLEGLIGLLRDSQLSFFAVDEAHCVSMWGHDFRPHYRELHLLREQFPTLALHAYTATATERVRADVVEQLQLRDPEILVGNFDRGNLRYAIERRKPKLLARLRQELVKRKNESGIIYCITRKEVEETADYLRSAGESVVPYHAGLDDVTRSRNQEDFIEDRVRVVVATVAFGMGIDKPDVRFVIHTGLPRSIEHYQQESGRAGRDGDPADCVLFYSEGDFRKWEFMLQDQPDELRRYSLRQVGQVLDFCNSPRCRHQSLVEYFGQQLDAPCGGACDVCSGRLELVADAVVLSQKILSSVFRQGERFGIDYTAEVLKGSADERIRQNQHTGLSTFGLLKEHSKRAITHWISQLAAQQFLCREGEFSVLKITPSGWKLLKGDGRPLLTVPPKVNERELSSVKAGQASDKAPLSAADAALFEKLRELRLRIARERSLPPYMIFSDATLREVASRQPLTHEAFRNCRGVGDRKLAEFGDQFVALIREETGQSETQVAQAVPAETAMPAAAADADTDDSHAMSRAALAAAPLYEQGQSVAEVARTLNRAMSTARGYLIEFIYERKVRAPQPWVSIETASQIEAAMGELGPRPMKAIFDSLNGVASYDDIAICGACWDVRDEEGA